MSYIVTVEKPGFGAKQQIDLIRFAKDLAQIYGASLQIDRNNLYPNEHQTLTGLANNLELELYADNWKKRVSVRVVAPDVPRSERKPATESITVNPDGRKINQIAADIQRRGFDASESAIKAQRENAVEQQKRRGNLRLHAEALKAALPELSVKVNESEQTAALYFNHDHAYIDATLYPDGTVSIHRIGSMSFLKFGRVMTVLTETPAKATA